MKKLMYIFFALPILTGCKEKKSAGAMGGMPTPEISVAKPIIKNVTLTKDYPGYLTTEKTVNLVARVNGTLQSTSYTAGGRVKQGQLLFVIEPTLYKDKVEQAEAALKTAQAQLEYARSNYSRMKEAVKSDAVSQIQVLQAESSVAEGVAAVNNAEAALSTAHTNLSYCYVRAPFDGTISKATVDVGSYVGGSLQPVTLATIYKDNQMYAYFNVADNQWLEMLMNNRQSAQELPKKIMVQLGKEGSEMYPATLDYQMCIRDRAMLTEMAGELRKALEQVPEPSTKEEKTALKKKRKQLKELEEHRDKPVSYTHLKGSFRQRK